MNHCTNYSSVDLFPNVVANQFNKYFSVTLMGLGIIGNAFGYILASKSQLNMDHNSNGPIVSRKKASLKKLSNDQFLIKYFYLINLINSLLILFSPILKLFGRPRNNFVWGRMGWAFYLAHVHYIISKGLVNLGFFLYIITFVNQFIAKIYPFKYNILVTKFRLICVMIASAVISIAWYIPIYSWLNKKRHFICIQDVAFDRYMNRKHLLPKPQYTANGVYLWFVRPGDTLNRGTKIYRERFTYEILREICLRIIPFITIMILKYFTLKHDRRVMNDIIRSHTTASHLSERSSPSYVTGDNNQDPRKILRQTNALFRRRSESSQEQVRTMFILTVEFILLLLPLAILQMVWYHVVSNVSRNVLARAYLLLSVFELIYVTCTFYFNLMFNPFYRKLTISYLKHVFFKK